MELTVPTVKTGVRQSSQNPSPTYPLADLFRKHSPTDTPLNDAELVGRLHHFLEEGRSTWPTLEVAPEAFVRHLASHNALNEQLDKLHAADLYLAFACVEHAQGALEAFEHAHMSRVGEFLARMRPSETLIDDVRQILREKLFVSKNDAVPKIAEYTGLGALASWLRVIAVRAALDLRRQSAREVEISDSEPEAQPLPSTVAEPELQYIKHHYRREFNEAVRTGVEALTVEQRELLQLHFIDRLTLDQLATKLDIHRATIARRIAVAREAIYEKARRLLQARLGADTRELDSLLHLMCSQIDVSLPGLLKKTKG